jgi:hypothetical protein
MGWEKLSGKPDMLAGHLTLNRRVLYGKRETSRTTHPRGMLLNLTRQGKG